jgi:hypothetical protein
MAYDAVATAESAQLVLYAIAFSVWFVDTVTGPE